MASVTLEQKRLEQLKQQLFGKSDSAPVKISPSKLRELNTKEAGIMKTTTLQSVSLKADLIKIAVLSAGALAIQLSLYFAHQHGLIKFF